MTELRYRSNVGVEDLEVGDCTMHRAGDSSGARWWLLWFRVVREDTGKPADFAVPMDRRRDLPPAAADRREPPGSPAGSAFQERSVGVQRARRSPAPRRRPPHRRVAVAPGSRRRGPGSGRGATAVDFAVELLEIVARRGGVRPQPAEIPRLEQVPPLALVQPTEEKPA